jgi:cytoskeletal protein RodZ
VLGVYYLPWWLLLPCLVASALTAYLVLRRIPRAGDSPWALFPLTAALASVVLVGAMVAAITLSTLLTAFVEGRTGAPTDHPSEPRALTERTSRGPTTTVERTHPATTEEQTTTTSTATPTATAAPTATATPYSRLR